MIKPCSREEEKSNLPLKILPNLKFTLESGLLNPGVYIKSNPVSSCLALLNGLGKSILTPFKFEENNTRDFAIFTPLRYEGTSILISAKEFPFIFEPKGSGNNFLRLIISFTEKIEMEGFASDACLSRSKTKGILLSLRDIKPSFIPKLLS